MTEQSRYCGKCFNELGQFGDEEYCVNRKCNKFGK